MVQRLKKQSSLLHLIYFKKGNDTEKYQKNKCANKMDKSHVIIIIIIIINLEGLPAVAINISLWRRRRASAQTAR